MRNFEVYIDRVPYMDSVKIYFIERYDGKTHLAKISENGYLEFKEINPEFSQEDEPALILPGPYWELFGRAILKALRDNGIEPEEKHFTKGKLEATEYHLEDLRKLLKINQ